MPGGRLASSRASCRSGCRRRRPCPRSAGEDDVVRDRGRAEVHRRQLVLPEHLAAGGVDGGEAAAALGEVVALPARPARRPLALRGWEGRPTARTAGRRRAPSASRPRRGHRGRSSVELARQRPGVVLVPADGARPQMLAVRRAVGEGLAHLAGDQHDLGLDALDRDGRHDRGDLQVVVAHVVADGLPEPEPLSGLAVEGDERVRCRGWARGGSTRSGTSWSRTAAPGWRRR